MRTTKTAHVVATSTLLLVLAGGCSLFERQGQGGTQATKLDLNTASRRKLATLPGLTEADADRIIAGRPYAKKHDLVDKKILDERKFDVIRDEVEVGHPSH